MKLQYSITFITLAAFSFNATAQKSGSIFSELSENGSAVVFTSPDGRYAGGYSSGYCHLYNEDNNGSEYYGDGVTNTYILTSVNNMGIATGAVSGEDISMSTPAYLQNGSWHELPFLTNSNIGSVSGVSADGTKFVGWCQKGWDRIACVWENGVVKELKIPALDPYGAPTMGAVADQISEDGKLIKGRYYLNYGDPVLAIWRNTDEECELPFIDMTFDFDNIPTLPRPEYEDYVTVEWGDPLYDEQFNLYYEAVEAYNAQLDLFEKKVKVDPSATYMSPNGKYMATTKFDGNTFENIPGRINMEDMSLTLLDSFSDAIALSASNTGDMTVATPFYGSDRTPYVYLASDEIVLRMDTWLKDEYGVDIMDSNTGIPSTNYDADPEVAGSPIMNGDGSRIHGYTYDNNWGAHNYHIKLNNPNAIVKNTHKEYSMKITDNKIFITGTASKVEIYSASGALVKMVNTPADVISLQDMPHGIYIVKASFNGNSVVEKAKIQ